MKAVLQRVINASVTVDGQIISSIGKGLMVLVGIDRNDTPEDRSTLIKRILSAKLFDDETTGGAWKRNVTDIGGEILCVSQFTLLAQFKGTKPDFHESMSTVPGRAFYTAFLDEIKAAYTPDKIKDGQFGAMMQVALTNDGPVTVTISSTDSRRGKDKPRDTGSSTGPTTSGAATPAKSKSGKSSKKASGTNTPRMGDEDLATEGQAPFEDRARVSAPDVSGLSIGASAIDASRNADLTGSRDDGNVGSSA